MAQQKSDETPQARIAALEAEVAQLRADLAVRFDELAVLARMIETGPALPVGLSTHVLQANTHDENLSERLHDADPQAAAQIADLVEQLEEITRHRDALLASTSWKLTAPVRRVSMLLRSRR